MLQELRRAASLSESGPRLTPTRQGAEPAPRGIPCIGPRLRIAPGRRLFDRAGVDNVLVFLIPCVINGAMLIYFLTGFRSHVGTEDRAGGSDAELPLRLPHTVRGTVACVGRLVTESADG